MSWLMSLLGRCRHERYTWPQTKQGQTYVVCLSCGSKSAYSWELMRTYDPEIEQRNYTAAQAVSPPNGGRDIKERTPKLHRNQLRARFSLGR